MRHLPRLLFRPRKADRHAERRLAVFRREPVMKVSMNVRLRPLVRCSFDETQGQLRVALMEPAEDTQQERVVVYALKVRPHVAEHVPPLTRGVSRGARRHGPTLRTLRRRLWRARGSCVSSRLRLLHLRCERASAFIWRWSRRCLLASLTYLLLYHYVSLCYHDDIYAHDKHCSFQDTMDGPMTQLEDKRHTLYQVLWPQDTYYGRDTTGVTSVRRQVQTQ